ncbi:MAG: hypothetical protein U0166_02770 [Acidobacteriota bacterium]
MREHADGDDAAWLDVLMELTNEKAVESVLRRLHVEAIGDLEAVIEAGAGLLASMDCRDPKLAFSAIQARIGSNPYGHIDITPSLVDKILDGLLPPPSVVEIPERQPSPGPSPPTDGMPLPLPTPGFVGRESELASLDEWTGGEQTRLVVVEGMAGIGKTSLVVELLRRDSGTPCRKAFYWNARLEPSLDDLFARLDRTLGKTPSTIPGTPLRRALGMGHCIFIDDVDALPGDTAEIILAGLGDRGITGKVIVTCQTAPKWALRRLGLDGRLLPLGGLRTDEAEPMLRRVLDGVASSQGEAIVRGLFGHPLVLRLYASLPPGTSLAAIRNPSDLDSGATSDELASVVARLTRTSYEALNDDARAVMTALSMIAIADNEVLLQTIRSIDSRIPTRVEASLPKLLANLEGAGLVMRLSGDGQAPTWRAHPLVREQIRADALKRDPDIAGRLAVALIPASSTLPPALVVARACDAIEALITAGKIREAHGVFEDRLQHGRLIKTAPAVHAGIRCIQQFVATEERRRCVEEQLPRGVLAFMLGEVALLAHLGGDVETSLRYHEEAIAARRALGLDGRQELATTLENYADLLVSCGELDEAFEMALESNRLVELLYQEKGGNVTLERNRACSLAQLGHVALVLDLLDESRRCLVAARRGDRFVEMFTGQTVFRSVPALREAQLEYECGNVDRARDIAVESLALCEGAGLGDDTHRWCTFLGSILTQSAPSLADGYLSRAESLVREGGHLRNLPEVLLARAQLALDRNEYEHAYSLADEALTVAASRGLRLWQIEALTSRGKAVLEDFRSRGLDRSELLRQAAHDADSALRMARVVGAPRLTRVAAKLRYEIAVLQSDTTAADRADGLRLGAEVRSERVLAAREELCRRLTLTTSEDDEPQD